MQQVGLQKAIATYLASEKCNFNASEFLSKRMKRWRSSVSEPGKEWWNFCGPFIAQLCRNELVGAPQCVVAAYLKTILNGWASARRLRLQDQCCFSGCGTKLDCIEHYLNCKVVRDIWERIEGVHLKVGLRSAILIFVEELSECASYTFFLDVQRQKVQYEHRLVHRRVFAGCKKQDHLRVRQVIKRNAALA